MEGKPATEQSVKIANRLRELRESAGLKPEQLSKAVFEKTGVEISRNSIINYEVGESYNSKTNKNLGMRAEYVIALADFFHVSTDYLLGRTSTPSVNENIQIACRVTRLSQKSVQNLIRSIHDSWGAWRKNGGVVKKPYPVIDVINMLLESGQLKDFFEYLGLFLIYGNEKFFNQTPVAVTQDEMNRVVDRMEYDGYSAAEHKQLSELNLQLACDTLKKTFYEILDNEKGRSNNGKH